jgi:zinc and cadmium transporter
MFIALLFALLASVADLSGLLLFWKKGWAKRYSRLLVSFAAGALLGAAFLDLLPEVLEHGGDLSFILLGLLLFYLLERIIFLYHCHHDRCDFHAFSYMMLVGNTLHDFTDGVIIGLAFLVDFNLGVVVSLAVIAHELPSGVGEFSVLIHGGFKEREAFLYTALSILATPLGTLVTILASSAVEEAMGTLLALATGGFIYVAAVDLIPETHEEHGRQRSVLQGICLVLGTLVVFLVGEILGGHG